MTRREWKIRATARLAGTDAPAAVASLLLCHVLGIDKVALVAHSEEPVPAEAEAVLEELLRRRLSGEPVAYILGRREFYGRDFLVNPHTLIPRPETEHLIEAALDFFQSRQDVRFLDLGTGSGCIAVTLSAERPSWRGVAVDISEARFARAAQCRYLRTENRVDFLQADSLCPCRLLLAALIWSSAIPPTSVKKNTPDSILASGILSRVPRWCPVLRDLSIPARWKRRPAPC